MFHRLNTHLLLWLSQPPSQPVVPDPAPQVPPGKLSEAANTILAWLKWGGLVSAVGAFFVAGIMMEVGRRNRNNMAVEGAMSVPWVVGGMALILASASIVGFVLGGQQ